MRSTRTFTLIVLTFALCSLSHYRNYKTSKFTIENSRVLSLFEYFNEYYSYVYKNMTVVLGSDSNPTYLFPLPITVLFWRRLGVPSIICFANSSDNFMDESAQLVLKSLRILQAQLIFLNTTLAPTHTIAQTCRLYVASSPVVKLRDSHVLITSDSDLWSFKLQNHVPSGRQKIFLYNSECCGLTSKPNDTEVLFPMRAMATIAMSARLWRELMEVQKGWLTNGDVLSKRLYEEYSEDLIKNGLGKPYISGSWYADQIIISQKIFLFENRSGFRDEWIGKRWLPPFRIDRAGWPTGDLMNVYASYVDDSHILHPLHDSYNWMLTKPLLEVFLNKNISRMLTKYRNIYNHLLAENNASFSV